MGTALLIVVSAMTGGLITWYVSKHYFVRASLSKAQQIPFYTPLSSATFWIWLVSMFPLAILTDVVRGPDRVWASWAALVLVFVNGAGVIFWCILLGYGWRWFKQETQRPRPKHTQG
jgi:hypothetical protein